MKIGLFTSVYFNNIGNGFIDLGAEYTITSAKPKDAEFVKFSQCANFAASVGKQFVIKENPFVNWIWVHIMQKLASKLQDKSYKTVNSLDVFSVAKIVKLDYLIIPGCVLTVPFFTIYGGLLETKIRQGCKLIFLGVSGNFYNDYEVQFVSDYLDKLKPYGIISRDSNAFNLYKKYAKYTYNGIDNVFFVNRLQLPTLETTESPYVVINLEEPKHKLLKREIERKHEDKNIIYTNHKPFPFSKIAKFVKKEKTMISDYPMDYLILYKNAEAVYSDRVHACIPTISFSNDAFLFSDSPRKALFENVGISKMTKEPLAVKNLANMQNDQIDFLASILK